MREAIAATDAQVLQMCASAAPPVNYSSTTAVAALISGDLLSVAHLGDSRAALGSAKFAVPAGGGSGALRGRWLTSDHKPDMPEERARIERVRFAAALADALASCVRVVAMLPSILLNNDTPPPLPLSSPPPPISRCMCSLAEVSLTCMAASRSCVAETSFNGSQSAIGPCS